MEDLETVLRKVTNLGRDLSAEKVIQEEIWENGEEILGDSSWNFGMPTGKYEKDKMVQPGITEPDTQKRKTARIQLQQIYDSSEWYSARYMAGKKLRIDNEKLILQSWINDLDSRLGLGKIETAKDLRELISYVPPNSLIKKSKKLKTIAKKHYNTNELIEIRREMGKSLGYSNSRIWVHEYLVATTLIGLVTIGATSVLSYILYKYFTK